MLLPRRALQNSSAPMTMDPVIDILVPLQISLFQFLSMRKVDSVIRIMRNGD